MANYRAQRTRRRLYLMVVSILVPFFPIVLTLAILNIKDMGPMQPYNYDEIHNHEVPSWGSIIYMPSNYIPFSLMNIAYIPILTSIAVFIFFGLTKDAMDDYRKVLLFLCLGRVFPRLYREYDPGRPGFSDGSFGSSQYTSQSG